MLVAALAGAALAAPPASPSRAAAPFPAATSYYCIVHPEITSPTPGLCRKCGNPLVPGDPWAQREFVVDLQTEPRAPRAGHPVELRLAVLDADSREPVVDFNVLQDRRLHVIVVSQDLAEFAHVHPEQRADGSWSVTYPVARAGFYRAFVKFSALGSLPQVMARTFATGGFEGDLTSSVPRLVPDRTLVRTAGPTTVALTIEPARIAAGLTVKLRYELTAGGTPVTDLEPYDAGFGHAVVLSEDALDFVRADPIEGVPADVADPRGGPVLRFDATFPRAGRYRTWFQFRRGGVLWTVPFTVEAHPKSSRRPSAPPAR